MLFQPLEEAARLIFSRLGPQSPETTDKARPSRENSGNAGLLLLLLRSLVKLVVLVGLVFSCLGFNYTRLLLSLLLGRGKQGQGGWGGEAAWLLSCYCVYVSALALNGMTEAFVYAVATHTQVTQLHDTIIGYHRLGWRFMAWHWETTSSPLSFPSSFPLRPPGLPLPEP